MVALSGLDTNKCGTVLAWKSKTDSHLLLDGSMDVGRSSIVVSEFGDLKVTKIRQPQKRLNDEEIAQAAVDYQNGMTLRQIAAKFGCNRDTVSANLKKHGVNVTKSKVSSKLDAKQVIALYEDMQSSKQIAELFGMKPQVIVRCLHTNNVPIRSRWDY